MLADEPTTAHIVQLEPLRPGCVVLIVWSLINNIVYSLYFGVALTKSHTGSDAIKLYLLVVVPTLGMLLLVGLWQMKEWGRKLVIGLQVINIIMNGFAILTGQPMLLPLASIGISASIIYWLARKKVHFT